MASMTIGSAIELDDDATEDFTATRATTRTTRRNSFKPAMILRSDPHGDLRPFIESLWLMRSDMCRTIYTDMFPRGVDNKGATRQEEEAFLAQHFDTQEILEQGGRFLKQVLYSIALYNDSLVKEKAAAWQATHAEYFQDKSLVNAMLKITSATKFFSDQDTSEHGNDEQLLTRIMLLVQSETVQLRAQSWINLNADTFDDAAKLQSMLQARTPKQFFYHHDLKANANDENVLRAMMFHIQNHLASIQTRNDKPLFAPVTYETSLHAARNVIDKFSPTTTSHPDLQTIATSHLSTYQPPNTFTEPSHPRPRGNSFRGGKASRGRGRGGKGFLQSSTNNDHHNTSRATNNRGERFVSQQENTPPNTLRGQRSSSWLAINSYQQQTSERRIFSEGDGNAYGGSYSANNVTSGSRFTAGTGGPSSRYDHPFSPTVAPFHIVGTMQYARSPRLAPLTTTSYPVVALGIPPGETQHSIDAWVASIGLSDHYMGCFVQPNAAFLHFNNPQVATNLVKTRFMSFYNIAKVRMDVPYASGNDTSSYRGIAPLCRQMSRSTAQEVSSEERRLTNPFPEDEVLNLPVAQPFSIRNECGQPVERTRLGGDARLSEQDPLPAPTRQPPAHSEVSDTFSGRYDEIRDDNGKTSHRNPQPTETVDQTLEMSSEDQNLMSPLLRPSTSLSVLKRLPTTIRLDPPTRPASQPDLAPRDIEHPASSEDAAVTVANSQVNVIQPDSPGHSGHPGGASSMLRPSKPRAGSSTLARSQLRNSTPFRIVTNQSTLHTPGTDDVEDSFQTAAESPGSDSEMSEELTITITTQTPVSDVLPSGDKTSDNVTLATEKVANSPIARSSNKDASPPRELFGSTEPVTFEASDIEAESETKSTQLESPTRPDDVQQSSKQSKLRITSQDLLKATGPKQTESLSPYARQAQTKRKDRKSKSKAAASKTLPDKDTRLNAASFDEPRFVGKAGKLPPAAPTSQISAGASQQPSPISSHDGVDETPLSPTKAAFRGLKGAFTRHFKSFTSHSSANLSVDTHTFSGKSSPSGKSKVVEGPAIKLDSQQEYKDLAHSESPSTSSSDSQNPSTPQSEKFIHRPVLPGIHFGLDGAVMEGSSGHCQSKGKGKATALDDELEQVAGASESTRTLSPTPVDSKTIIPTSPTRKLSPPSTHLMQGQINRLSARKKRKSKKVKASSMGKDDDAVSMNQVSEKTKPFIANIIEIGTKDGQTVTIQPSKGNEKKSVTKSKVKTPTQEENERKENLRYPMQKLEHDERVKKFIREGDFAALQAEKEMWERFERKRRGEPEPFVIQIMQRLGLASGTAD